MDSRRICFFASLMISALAMGCSPSDTNETTDTTTSGTTDTAGDVLDARVPIPEADPEYFDFVSPEITIAPGDDKMLCIHSEIPEEMTIDNLKAFQGKFGHHIVLLTAKEPMPAGTLEDCTDRKAMTKYGPFVLPDTPLSAGYGVLVPKGLKIVMQVHYINAGAKPELIRDVARMHLIPKASVTKWVHTMATSDNTLSLAPQQKTSLHFDCEIPAGTELLVAGGHMHEHGTRFEMSIGKDEASLASLYLVDPWKIEFRDAPPVSLFFENPMVIADKSILRTNCEFNNESPNDIIFPEEMCATFGYVAGVDAPIDCQINPQ